MIYDKLPVTLLTALATQGEGSPNAELARYVLTHANDLDGLSIKDLAAACHVGAGTVSRFAREVGFDGFSELREAFAQSARSYQRVDGATSKERARALALGVARSLEQVASSVDQTSLALLVADLRSYRRVSAFGLLKAQAAALELQVNLLMQGRLVETTTSAADQMNHIATATSDELIVVFSYTASYFDACDMTACLRRGDRPRIWMVCGSDRPLPPFVHDRLLFSSSLEQTSHPYQLQFVAGLIAQEYAAVYG